MKKKDQLTLWIAQGFGLGRIPVAPGTFGSLLGLPIWCLLIGFGHPLVFWGGLLVGFALSVVISGKAEEILKLHDPGSVVIDEYMALPFCYAGWHVVTWTATRHWPGWEMLTEFKSWMIVVLGFGLFRLFDALKPWPISLCQNFVGGWGVTLDDYAAALAVNVVLMLVTGFFIPG